MDNVIKKAIYVSLKSDSTLETLARKNGITIIQRLQNGFNVTNLVRENLRALNNAQILILDLQAILGSSENKEIIENLTKIRELSDLERIIIIAKRI